MAGEAMRVLAGFERIAQIGAALPPALLLAVGVPALATLHPLWFLASWSDAAFVAVIAFRWLWGAYWFDPNLVSGRADASRWLFVLGPLVTIAVASWDRVHGAAAEASDWLAIAGLAALALALAVDAAAMIALPRYTLHRGDLDAALAGPTTHGIYSVIRHPMYAALVLAAVGLPLAARSVLGLAVSLAFVLPAATRRLRVEEAELVRFAGSRAEWLERTWRVIPFVY